MSWEVVARKDFQDSVRSRWLQGLTVLFVVLVAGVIWVLRPGPGETVSSNQVLNSLLLKDALVTTLVPLIALVVAYNAVVGERESGSLKLLLSLPHSRADVVAGKVIGRSAAFGVAVLVGFLLPALALALGPLQFEVGSFVGFTLLTALLGAVFVAIAVGASAAVPSNTLAIGITVGLYFLFVPLWGAVQIPLQLYFQVSSPPAWLSLTGPEVIRLLRLLNPTGAFKIVTNAYLGSTLFAGDQARLHLGATAMLLAWLLAPPLFGLWRFERADL